MSVAENKKQPTQQPLFTNAENRDLTDVSTPKVKTPKPDAQNNPQSQPGKLRIPSFNDYTPEELREFYSGEYWDR